MSPAACPNRFSSVRIESAIKIAEDLQHRTDQPLTPIQNADLRAGLPSHFGGLGFNLVAAIQHPVQSCGSPQEPPHDQADTGRCRIPDRHRRARIAKFHRRRYRPARGGGCSVSVPATVRVSVPAPFGAKDTCGGSGRILAKTPCHIWTRGESGRLGYRCERCGGGSGTHRFRRDRIRS